MLDASMAHDLHLIALDPILISPASTLIFILSNNSTKLCGNVNNFSHDGEGKLISTNVQHSNAFQKEVLAQLLM
jgi:hypothetical protein